MRISLEVETAPAGIGNDATVMAAAAIAAKVRLYVDIWMAPIERRVATVLLWMRRTVGESCVPNASERPLIHIPFTVVSQYSPQGKQKNCMKPQKTSRGGCVRAD